MVFRSDRTEVDAPRGQDARPVTTKGELSAALGVSTATLNNWIRLGYVPAPDQAGGYSPQTAAAAAAAVAAGHRLKSRANRSLNESRFFSCHGGRRARERLARALELHAASGLTLEQGLLGLCIALLRDARLAEPEHPQNGLDLFLLAWADRAGCRAEDAAAPFGEVASGADPLDDIPGAFYQSLSAVAGRSRSGSFFTPAALLADLRVPQGVSVLDPCCGSGGLLMRVLDRSHESGQLSAWDIDPLALALCRVNLSLFFERPDPAIDLRLHDIVLDGAASDRAFDYIISNPPWGARSGPERSSLIRKRYPDLATAESFSVALHNCLGRLAAGGTLVFFMPHAFMNVGSHRGIRRHLAGLKPEMEIRLLGQAFPGVMSEAVRVRLHRAAGAAGMVRVAGPTGEGACSFGYERLAEPDFVIPRLSGPADLRVMEALYARPHDTLRGQADFALGLVTGDNDRHLCPASGPGLEPVYRGRDIRPFGFAEPSRFIRFQPDRYQQAAPVEFYRGRKIMYRFICDRLVCALDEAGRLSLNSANCLIPANGYPLETIVLLFNSRLYAWLFRTMFHARKVLRSHIEGLPLPRLSPDQHRRARLAHDALAGFGAGDAIAWEELVYSFFELRPEDIRAVESLFDRHPCQAIPCVANSVS